MLFVGHLIDCNLKASSVKSYISAIRGVLLEDGIKISEDKFLISSLTRACRIRCDKISTRLPIKKDLLMLILKEIKKYFHQKCQPFLATLFQALFATTYFGLFRIGEVTHSQHVVKAKDVHIGLNKKKLLFVLWTSKTHGRSNNPQLIKICSQQIKCKSRVKTSYRTTFCPFKLLNDYLQMRPNSLHDNEQFFVCSDNSPVMPRHMRDILKTMLKKLNLVVSAYTIHGLRLGRTTDLLRLGLSVETIKKVGRWKSNAVFLYLRD